MRFRFTSNPLILDFISVLLCSEYTLFDMKFESAFRLQFSIDIDLFSCELLRDPESSDFASSSSGMCTDWLLVTKFDNFCFFWGYREGLP